VALGVAVLVDDGVTLGVMVRVGVGVRVRVGVGVALGGRSVAVKVGSISIVTGGVGVMLGVALHAAIKAAIMPNTADFGMRPIMLAFAQ
jgi:hypothetical protein